MGAFSPVSLFSGCLVLCSVGNDCSSLCDDEQRSRAQHYAAFVNDKKKKNEIIKLISRMAGLHRCLLISPAAA